MAVSCFGEQLGIIKTDKIVFKPQTTHPLTAHYFGF